jgi:hypothetical protein
MKTVTIAVVSLLLLLGLSSCQQQGAGPVGAPAGKVQASYNRADLEGFIDKYIDAMLAKNVDPALFAKNVRFTENGVPLPLGDEGLWSSMVGKGTYKFYVPDIEINQVAFIGTAREESNTEKDGDPVALAIRLKIEDGLISEAEQLVIRADSGMGGGNMPPAAVNIERGVEPHPIYREAIPESERPSREDLIVVANKYFTGMQKNDGMGDYPFTDDCHRLENGMETTNAPLRPGQTKPDPKTSTSYSTAWGCKEQYDSGLLHFVTRIRDRRFVAVDRERGIVFAFGFFDHAAGKTRHFTTHDGRQISSGPIAPWTWQIAELFRIENNQIRRVEAVLQKVPYGMNSGWSTFEDGWSDKIQIVK